MGFDPVTAAIGAGISYFGGKGARSKANQAQREYAANMQSIIAQAEKTYGPAATEAAINRAMDEIAAEYQQHGLGAERSLYARGMGERSVGTRAALEESEAKQRMGVRGTLEAEYPQRLLNIKAGMLPSQAAYAGQLGEEAAAATALPWQLIGAYQGATKGDPLADYLKRLIKQGMGGGTTGGDWGTTGSPSTAYGVGSSALNAARGLIPGGTVGGWPEEKASWYPV